MAVEIVVSFGFTKPLSLSKPEVTLPGAALGIEQGRDVARAFAVSGLPRCGRLVAVAAVGAALLISACSSGGGAPAAGGSPAPAPAPVPAQLTRGGPPPTFSRTTADLKVSRLIDVRDAMTNKGTLFSAVRDVLSSKFSIDVSDQRAGFLMTPWQASFSRGGMPDLRYRTRVIVRFVGEDWRQVLVRAEANWQRDDEWDIGVDNALLDEVVNDVRNRIGKKPAG